MLKKTLFSLVVVLSVAACSPNADVPPTPTKTPAAVTPTDDAAPAADAAPPPSLTAEDLPAGFAEVPREQLSDVSGAVGENIDIQNYQVFINPETETTVLTFSGTVAEGPSEAVDVLIQPGIFSQVVFGTLQPAREPEQLDASYGDISFGLSEAITQQGTTRILDSVVFREGRTLAFVSLLYSEGVTPDVTIITLADTLFAQTQ